MQIYDSPIGLRVASFLLVSLLFFLGTVSLYTYNNNKSRLDISYGNHYSNHEIGKEGIRNKKGFWYSRRVCQVRRYDDSCTNRERETERQRKREVGDRDWG